MFFRKNYFFLSNFFASPIEFEYDGHIYLMPTVENAFQGAKVLVSRLSAVERHELLAKVAAGTPGESKEIGRSLPLNIEAWNFASQKLMLEALRRKFKPGSELAAKLLDTGDIEIVEDNDHGDRIWGRVDGEGENRLGILLQQVRGELRAA